MNTTTTHTPGPWAVSRSNRGMIPVAFQPPEVLGRDGQCCVASQLGNGPEADANARLIAAAPELLAALRGAQSALRKALPYLPADGEAVYAGEWLDEINEAIAKAEGKR